MGEVEKLALITEALEQFAHNSKILVAFELGKKEFDDLFRKLNTKSDKIFLGDNGRITVDISGINFHFVSEGVEL